MNLLWRNTLYYLNMPILELKNQIDVWSFLPLHIQLILFSHSCPVCIIFIWRKFSYFTLICQWWQLKHIFAIDCYRTEHILFSSLKFHVSPFLLHLWTQSEYIIIAAPLPLQKCCCKLHQVISCPIERGRLVSTLHFQPNFQLTFTGQNQP